MKLTDFLHVDTDSQKLKADRKFESFLGEHGQKSNLNISTKYPTMSDKNLSYVQRRLLHSVKLKKCVFKLLAC